MSEARLAPGPAFGSAPGPSRGLALARTFLFVPADRPERHARALATGAGGVIVDLEDAVAPERKTSARGGLAASFAALPPQQRVRLLVRINAAGTPWHDDDCAQVGALAAQGLIAGVVLPKAERAADLSRIAQAIGPEGVLVPLIESVAGLDAADALAAAPQVLRLAFGNLDFQADLGLACDADEAELVPVRLALLMASRRAGLPAPIDGVTADWRDAARLAADTARARRGGFGAKLCIHPEQVAPVHAALGPGADELAWARRVVDAIEASGGGVVSLDGKMVDAPLVRLAERMLARGAQAVP
jgi:citrate lyase subunit beta/citryl-CoA lyase